MTNTASRQKATNTNSSVNANMNNSAKMNTNANKASGKNANVASTSAPVKPASAKATAAVAVPLKQTATVVATPTRAVQSAGANPNKKGKNKVKSNTNVDVNANAAANANKIGKTNNAAAAANNAAAAANNAKSTNAKATANGKTNQPVTANTNVKNAMATNNNSRGNDAKAASETVKKSANAVKTNDKTKAKTNGKINVKINAKLESHMVGVSFVLRLVLGLAPEKRADCQILREILSHESHARLVLTPSGKGLKPASGVSTAANAKEWAKLSQDQRRQVARQAQSDKFQEAMQQLGGERLYASIRTQLSQASDEFVWDASKDKPALQQTKVVRPRSGSADYKNKSRISKASKETAKWSQVPPPAPVSVKSSPIKKYTALKTSGQVKNASPMKNGTPVKNVSAVGAWGGAVPASIVQSRPGAIVSSAPTFSARAGNGGRAILSRAL